MQPDLNAIERRLESQKSMRPESWDAWCLHAVSDVAALLAHVRALEAERARLREALDTRERQLRAAVSGIGRREHCTLVMHDAKGRIIDVVHTAPDGPETASQPWVPLPELLPINIARAALDPNRSE
jgi:hypothetical protein